MYARMLLVDFDSKANITRFDLANRWHAGVSTLPGFISVSFLSDESTGEQGYISYWETLEQAIDAGEKVGRQLPRALANVITSPPRIRYFEVYEPDQ